MDMNFCFLFQWYIKFSNLIISVYSFKSIQWCVSFLFLVLSSMFSNVSPVLFGFSLSRSSEGWVNEMYKFSSEFFAWRYKKLCFSFIFYSTFNVVLFTRWSLLALKLDNSFLIFNVYSSLLQDVHFSLAEVVYGCECFL